MLRLANIALVLALIVSAVFLYSIEHKTREAERQVASLKSQINEERETIRLLRAEWSNLTRPQRLQKLAQRHLGLNPVKPGQKVRRRNLGTVLPERPAVVPHAADRDPIADMLKGLQ